MIEDCFVYKESRFPTSVFERGDCQAVGVVVERKYYLVEEEELAKLGVPTIAYEMMNYDVKTRRAETREVTDESRLEAIAVAHAKLTKGLGKDRGVAWKLTLPNKNINLLTQ